MSALLAVVYLGVAQYASPPPYFLQGYPHYQTQAASHTILGRVAGHEVRMFYIVPR